MDREALAREAEAQIQELRARVEDMNQRVLAFIRERPATALLIAAGAGFLVGRILRS